MAHSEWARRGSMFEVQNHSLESFVSALVELRVEFRQIKCQADPNVFFLSFIFLTLYFLSIKIKIRVIIYIISAKEKK